MSVDYFGETLKIKKIEIGTRIGFNGRYEIRKLLGEGGMGRVYAAYDRELEIELAIKVLPSDIIKNKKELAYLKKEAKLSIKLSHSNIIRLYTFEIWEDIPYIVMEKVGEGKTLSDVLMERGRLSIKDTLVILKDIVEGLEHAHKKKIIHLDLKPDNILFDEEGKAKIADFSIAMQIRASMSRISNAPVAGTLLYMAPEQLMGKNLGTWTDVYALGCIVHEMLSGEPVINRYGDIYYQIEKGEPEDIDGVSEEINKVIKKALAKKIEDRFHRAGEFYKALEEAVISSKFEEEKPEETIETEEIEKDKELERLEEKKELAEYKEKKEKEERKALEEIKTEKETKKSEETKPEEQPKTSEEIKEKKKSKGWVYALVACIIIVIIGGYFVYFSNVKGKITIKSSPEEASVYINGDYKGVTPLKNIELPKGNYRIEVKKEGYGDWDKEVQIKAGETKVVKANLIKLSSELSRKKPDYLGMEFVWIKGGCYEMGCGSWTDDCDDDEKPVHEVCVDGFWIGKYEVTFEEYDRFCDETGRKKPDDEGWGRGRRPVINVSWNDAKAFAKWYGKKVGMDCRLPTEAEWEYACRSGGKKEKYAGTSDDNELYRYANFCDKNCKLGWQTKSQNDGYEYTAPVGSFMPNGLGIYDMSGNVWEWCEDIYDKNAYNYDKNAYKKHSRQNPIYRGNIAIRVVRGGGCFDVPWFVRCSNRDYAGASGRSNGVGFRIVCK